MAANKGPLHQFEISNIYDIKLYNTDISFTNSSLSMLIAVSLASLMFYVGSKKECVKVCQGMQIQEGMFLSIAAHL